MSEQEDMMAEHFLERRGYKTASAIEQRIVWVEGQLRNAIELLRSFDDWVKRRDEFLASLNRDDREHCDHHGKQKDLEAQVEHREDFLEEK